MQRPSRRNQVFDLIDHERPQEAFLCNLKMVVDPTSESPSRDQGTQLAYLND
jgi:hypothetical protein